MEKIKREKGKGDIKKKNGHKEESDDPQNEKPKNQGRKKKQAKWQSPSSVRTSYLYARAFKKGITTEKERKSYEAETKKRK